jgi:uncharacterized protein (TIGR02246 family)
MTDVAHDELAVRDLTARFTDAVNRRDPETLGALFTEDGEWVVPGVPTSVGPEAAAAQIRGLLSTFVHLVQLLHSGHVEVDGDVATATWYLTESASDGGDAAFGFTGVYRDEARRTDDGWRFSRREFTFLHREKRAAAGKWYPHPAAALA